MSSKEEIVEMVNEYMADPDTSVEETEELAKLLKLVQEYEPAAASKFLRELMIVEDQMEERIGQDKMDNYADLFDSAQDLPSEQDIDESIFNESRSFYGQGSEEEAQAEQEQSPEESAIDRLMDEYDDDPDALEMIIEDFDRGFDPAQIRRKLENRFPKEDKIGKPFSLKKDDFVGEPLIDTSIGKDYVGKIIMPQDDKVGKALAPEEEDEEDLLFQGGPVAEANLLNDLLKLADKLDQNDLEKEADLIDNLIRKLSGN
jgi:hypothetical protein